MLRYVLTGEDVLFCRACSVMPTVNVNGTLRHLLLTPVQLDEYQLQMHHVLTRYLQRLQWLLSGACRKNATEHIISYHVRNLWCVHC